MIPSKLYQENINLPSVWGKCMRCSGPRTSCMEIPEYLYDMEAGTSSFPQERQTIVTSCQRFVELILIVEDIL